MIQAAKLPYVRFETEVSVTKDEDGHNQYKNVIMAHITPAGSKDEIVKLADEWIVQLMDKSQTRGPFDSAANEYEDWHKRFSKMLDSYKNGIDMATEGTPIRASLAFSPAEVAQCESVKIFTLEALAVCNEQAMNNMGMGGRTLKQKAEKILENFAGSKVAEENTALKSKLEAMQEQLDKLMANQPEKAEKKRKPKE